MSMQTISHQSWIDRWDRQQELYLPCRETRFDVIFDTVVALGGLEGFTQEPQVLDLACGPGAIGQRLLQRFPGATCVGIDIDPVLLRLAAEVAAPFGNRFEVYPVDLALADWAARFGNDTYDVITSSTALHWLNEGELKNVAQECLRILKPGGVLFNADNLAFSTAHNDVQRLASYIDDQHQRSAAADGAESWAQWWYSARLDPVLGPLCDDRDIRFPPAEQTDSPPPTLDLYVTTFNGAGFKDVTTIWQRFDDRVLLARRPHDAAAV